ncbi:arginase [Flavobacterium luminosum]|uniref:Arginase n=1 Tax=Flavobacterium luminosum TaxID=2949086 RepID=A0ABT0TP37_9FLAO|nr:arginase [Flavobacterium sp. HXWNR70]MCL9809140.1 arginase [Flavobacterium sp. HXWNR70]
MSTNVTFLINKSEITAGTRGASLGPDAIMTAARTKGSYLFGENTLEQLNITNAFLDRPTKYPFAKRIDGLLSVYQELNTKVADILNKNSFPIILAADHGSAGGTISGIKSAFPDKRIGVVWIDAHADIHTPYTTPSGNMHGMPLASVMNLDNLECKVNEVDPETVSLWNELKAVGGITQKINPKDVVYVGVRDTEEQEEKIIKQLGIKWFTVDDVHNQGITAIVQQIEEQLKDCDFVYVTFDVDSMDPELTSYGTGTPVPNGISPIEAKGLLTALSQNQKTVCLEIVEVNPCLDEKGNTMAEVTLEIVEAITDVIKNRK